jgi:hypothetical protein
MQQGFPTRPTVREGMEKGGGEVWMEEQDNPMLEPGQGWGGTFKPPLVNA